MQHKSEQDLHWRQAKLLRRLQHGGMRQQLPPETAALCQRAVGHCDHMVAGLPGEQIIFNTPAAQMIQHLIDGAVIAVITGKQFLHIPGVKIGDAPAEDFALADQILHAADGLLQRNAAPPMEQVEIQMVCAHAAQRVLTGEENVLMSGIVGIDFRNKEQIVPSALLQHAADQRLRLTGAIHFGCVDKTDARVNTGQQGGLLFDNGTASLPKEPGAQPQGGDTSAGMQCVFHAHTVSSSMMRTIIFTTSPGCSSTNLNASGYWRSVHSWVINPSVWILPLANCSSASSYSS